MADRTLKRVLIITFQFPPAGGSSGVQRALKFAKFLPEFGWEPLILTVTPNAYPVVTNGSSDLGMLGDFIIGRGWAVDAGRLLRFRGRYPSWINVPDRWASWWLTAIPVGLNMIRKYEPRAIFSTFPIATAHLIAQRLARASGLPWIADFRDPMLEGAYPPGRLRRKILRKLETQTVENSSSVVFVTRGLRAMYERRYPTIDSFKWHIIPNGFDEDDFTKPTLKPRADDAMPGTKAIRIVHSGIIYASERDPSRFFDAMADLVKTGGLKKGEVEFVLRGSRNEGMCSRMIQSKGLADLVRLEPVTNYEDALQEMRESNGLLLLQGANCNRQIPAKLYEYFKIQKPILGLTDPQGDTGQLLLEHGIDTIAPLEDRAAIGAALVDFVSRIKAETAPIADEAKVSRYSRREGTRLLSFLLDEVIA